MGMLACKHGSHVWVGASLAALGMGCVSSRCEPQMGSPVTLWPHVLIPHGKFERVATRLCFKRLAAVAHWVVRTLGLTVAAVTCFCFLETLQDAACRLCFEDHGAYTKEMQGP